MKYLLIWLFIFSIFCFSQTIEVSGIITTIDGTPVSNASVKLVLANIETKTDNTGKYTLYTQNSSIKTIKINPNLYYLKKHDNIIINIYSSNGQLLSSNKIQYSDLSNHINTFLKQNGCGIFFVCIKTKHINKILKISNLPSTTLNSILVNRKERSFKKKYTDTLIVEKAGFYTIHWPLRNKIDTANIELIDETTHLTEIKMHNLVNNYRKSINLDTLIWSDVAAQYARQHSRNISLLKVQFGHDGFGQRVDNILHYINLLEPSENVVASYSTTEAAFNGWLNSPGHKANIENTYSNCTGIGYYKGSGTYNNVYTQIFFIAELE